VTGSSLRFPNGLVLDKEGLVYVAMTAAPYIGVYRFSAESKLKEFDRIHVGMPVDNLSMDSNGEIWAAGILKMFELIESIGDPFNKHSPATVFKIRKTSVGKYETTKALEDGEAKAVNAPSRPLMLLPKDSLSEVCITTVVNWRTIVNCTDMKQARLLLLSRYASR
jgi:hypothetical protein